MSIHRFRLLNVFVGEPPLTDKALSGNPLCVFEDGRTLDAARMMALARQFNLSETTFVLPPPGDNSATATVRIFTPTSDPAQAELSFAGHPSLGTAHVLRDLHGTGDEVVLQLPAGRVPVSADGDVWTLTAPFDGHPRTRLEPLGRAGVAAMLGLAGHDVAGEPTWVGIGREQLLLPLASMDALRRATPSADPRQWPANRDGRRNCYGFAVEPSGPAGGRERIRARYFVGPSASSPAYEDPGTGSACANLGGWLLASGRPRPSRFAIDQGIEMERPCRLLLDLTADGRVRVGGRVVEIARGELTLPGAGS